MELLISEIVARVLCKCANLYRDVNDAEQKAFTVLLGNIWQKTECSINLQTTKTELVLSNETKSTANDMHRIKREAILQKRFLPYH